MLKISIIIPCYNQGQYLDETLQSVLEQTYSNWECIIVNDGSPDETEIVSQKWAAKDPRFNYLYKKNGGLSSARNAGLEIAIGDFIQFLDADDYLDCTKLELSINAVTYNNQYDIVITNFRMFESIPAQSSLPYCTLTNDLFNFDDIVYKWEESFTIPIHCGLFQITLFTNFRFPEQLKAKEDWIMWIALYKNNCSTLFIDKPLALYRKNPNSMTQSMDMLGDFIKAYEYLKAHLSAEQYQKLTLVLLTRYYKSAVNFKAKLNEIKTKNTYFAGDFIKKSLRKLGLLKLFKCFLESTFNKK
jgi:glycosyltransferase involved in cell wall biosynthesis